MRYLSVNEFLSEDIDIREICVLPIREPVHQESIFKNKLRNCSVLFLYLSGKRQYTLENGNTFFLTPGDIMYVPQYATYKFKIMQGDPLDYAIAINFTLKDTQGEMACLGKAPYILFKDMLGHYQTRFLRALSIDVGAKTQTMLLKSIVYALAYELFSEYSAKQSTILPWKEIMPAIDQIESSPSHDTPIPQLAKMCGVCETKFRKLFLLYTNGLSPVQYRNQLRMEQVVRTLHTQQISVEQAARGAGFRDMAHFYRLYKKYQSKLR